MSQAIFSVFLLVLSFNLGGSLAAEVWQTWCVAKPSTSDSSLTDNMDFACDHVQDECNPIRKDTSNPCYNPDTLIHHGSFAMNAYYQKKGRHHWNCNFDNSGLISIKNPSYGSCVYTGGDTFMNLTSAQGKWCVATPSANNQVLQDSIDYACNHVDCSIITIGGPCYDPSSLISHASVAMNLYYQATGKLDSSCDFNGSGLIVIIDPSYGNCKFEFRQ
ncbi:hypothetical protein TIFTF001_012537 [Ficus carica]|uniref:X8 domain-containing protein n=1 Tax=Ficus carica TaxID=3494 RepID=A0AA87ZTI3_FICCA|nr:hypothetical protein TIFTF001_012537 [Ficus carica]